VGNEGFHIKAPLVKLENHSLKKAAFDFESSFTN
jgi:hypothetical protein